MGGISLRTIKVGATRCAAVDRGSIIALIVIGDSLIAELITSVLRKLKSSECI